LHSVKLVSITKPLIEGVETADEFIAYVARVSNPSNQLNTETAPKLLKYLIKNHHWSPFELVHLTMEIETTRDIARQILRHRSFTFQEFSQRYADPTQSLGFTSREPRLQDPNNRQNSVENDNEAMRQHWFAMQQEMIEFAQETYDWAIKNGMAKEQARAVLPEGLTMSRMYMSGSLRSWWHYCQLRCANGTQKEHMEIAKDCLIEILDQFPTLAEINTIDLRDE
jgi:thymidylate synthase (FAD)